MQTPVFDFVKKYAQKGITRLHMPGHKGRSFLGCEKYDITEIKNAGVLYETGGIIAQSEKNASKLFGTHRTFYSTEGSSLCIKAMLSLALQKSQQKTVIAARNVHKAFVHAAALLDFKVVWLTGKSTGLCGNEINLSQLEAALLENEGAVVYVTSPDYLGNIADIKEISILCKKYNATLCVDNAHGAYLAFLDNSHPIALGADICSDSAHKTLPVLTGGAYLHLSKTFEAVEDKQIKNTMSLFGSTSPSYLILASLDLCNKYLSSNYREKLTKTINDINKTKQQLRKNGWHIKDSDGLRITILATTDKSGIDIAERLRKNKIEPEFSDKDFCVLMLTTENTKKDLKRLVSALRENDMPPTENEVPVLPKPQTDITVREALFSENETISIENAIGRICADGSIACPPAVPVCICGEIITEQTVEVCKYYNINEICVTKKP